MTVLISKDTDVRVFRYRVPTEDGLSGWGIFLMDSNGMFTAVTDYGNYAFGWPHHGERDFRLFVAMMGEKAGDGYCDYLCGKLGSESEFESEKTVANIREYLYEGRREGWLPKDADEANDWVERRKRHAWYHLPYQSRFSGNRGYREEADLLKQLEDGELSPDMYVYESHIPEVYERLRYTYPIDLRMFATKLMPRLAALIRAELAAEQPTADEPDQTA